ncbi:hypothetical protein AMAG_08014 [Allomyces macrogynus ATCC 38327]|uniref:RRM domain-containing protein n=1 Tax=Allomyces macrogynus (strain ATCC 38327) TaxID=578462 RepID=A0A0L0SKA6_ALLM3|nr:hypothetical protein AMAG_08014 [Allomyces macrogynus ATCC 38327]|eukprot:KNE62835.1 hypothetical protein AMAG_08014 [Allomyces macrogynus ATCC 38327]
MVPSQYAEQLQQPPVPAPVPIPWTPAASTIPAGYHAPVEGASLTAAPGHGYGSIMLPSGNEQQWTILFAVRCMPTANGAVQVCEPVVLRGTSPLSSTGQSILDALVDMKLPLPMADLVLFRSLASITTQLNSFVFQSGLQPVTIPAQSHWYRDLLGASATAHSNRLDVHDAAMPGAQAAVTTPLPAAPTPATDVPAWLAQLSSAVAASTTSPMSPAPSVALPNPTMPGHLHSEPTALAAAAPAAVETVDSTTSEASVQDLLAQLNGFAHHERFGKSSGPLVEMLAPSHAANVPAQPLAAAVPAMNTVSLAAPPVQTVLTAWTPQASTAWTPQALTTAPAAVHAQYYHQQLAAMQMRMQLQPQPQLQLQSQPSAESDTAVDEPAPQPRANRDRDRSRSPSRRRRKNSSDRHRSRSRDRVQKRRSDSRSRLTYRPFPKVRFRAHMYPKGQRPTKPQWFDRLSHALRDVGTPSDLEYDADANVLHFSLPASPDVVPATIATSGIIIGQLYFKFEPADPAEMPPAEILPREPRACYALFNIPLRAAFKELFQLMKASGVFADLDLHSRVSPRNNTGYGFITLLRRSQYAAERLDGVYVQGRPIRVVRIEDPDQFFSSPRHVVDLVDRMAREVD